MLGKYSIIYDIVREKNNVMRREFKIEAICYGVWSAGFDESGYCIWAAGAYPFLVGEKYTMQQIQEQCVGPLACCDI